MGSGSVSVSGIGGGGVLGVRLRVLASGGGVLGVRLGVWGGEGVQL